MLAVVRIILLGCFVVICGVLGLLTCLIRPFHPNNTPYFAHWYGRMHKILGVKLDISIIA